MTEPHLYPRPMFWFLAVHALLGLFWALICLIDLILHPFVPDFMLQSILGRLVVGLLVAPGSILIGGLILRRERRNLIGLVLIYFGGALFASTIRNDITDPVALHIRLYYVASAFLTPIVLLTFYFPNGRAFPPRLARWIDPFLFVTSVLWAFATFFFSGTILTEEGLILVGEPSSNPFYLPVADPVFEFMRLIWPIEIIILVVLAPYSLFMRYRHGDRRQRLQMNWVASYFLIFFCALLLMLLIRLIMPDFVFPAIATSLFYLALPTLPVLAVGNAILRHRLYDIDIIINRTLVYSTLTALVIGIYVLVVGTMGAVFQSSGSFLTSLTATGVVAVSFHPLRERLQYLVDHYVYGERNNPYAVISSLSQRLETITAPGTLLPGIAETVAQALKLPFVSIALKSGAEFKTDAVYGQPADRGQITALPLTYGQEIVGQLVIGQTAGDKPLDASQHQLLANIARQAGTAAHAVQLSIDLQQSRQQIVTAREEERRRLRRDLHDGLGPALAAHTIKAGAARALIENNPQAADAILSELETNLSNSLTDIRRLVYNLRPPALDQLGLIGALNDFIQQCNQRGNAATVFILQSPAQLSELSAAVEVAAYRIVQEAVNNVIHHAHARGCQVKIETNGQLVIHIQDDGIGLPSPQNHGVGLHSMRERSEELGGHFSIQNRPGGGTEVQVWLPLQVHPVKNDPNTASNSHE